MINTSKDPNSTRPSSQAPSSQPRSITQRSRLARLGNPRDTGGPAPKRLTWPDHGDRNTSLGTLRRTRTTGANLPLSLASDPCCSKHPGTHNRSAGIELPILAAPWSDKVTRDSKQTGPSDNPGFSTPRYLCCWSSSIIVLLFQGRERYSRRRRTVPKQADAQARSRVGSRSRSWWRAIPGGEAKYLGTR